jgi:methylmalonyl-CoA mutase, N-terminal domain
VTQRAHSPETYEEKLAQLQEPRKAARGTENLLPRIRAALKGCASIGEVCGAMKDIFGEYQPEF